MTGPSSVVPRVRIQLLGGFHFDADARGVGSIDSPRLQALLAYLLLHRERPQRRSRIAFLFWPDTAEGQARTNLRQLLHHLRNALPQPDRFLRVERRTLRWAPDAPARVDLLELEKAWEVASAAEEAGEIDAAIAALKDAAELYAGDLLPALYEPWLDEERTRLRNAAVARQEWLVGWLEARREYGEAMAQVERLLAVDPLREDAHRARIRLSALEGDPARAARAYHECVRILAEQVGLEPSRETRELYARIRKGGVGRSAGPAAPDRSAPDWPLVGRHEPWEQLREAWERSAHEGPQFVVVTGEAGIGKTRLVEEFATWVSRQGAVAAGARCWAAEGLLAFGPAAQWLGTPGLSRAAASLDEPWATEVGRVVPELAGDADMPSDLEEPRTGLERLHLFEGLARAVLASGDRLLLVLDDLQWCDGDTLEWLHYLLRFDPESPVLLLGTIRTGEPRADPRFPDWLHRVRQSGSFHYKELELGPLGPHDTGALGAAVAGGRLTHQVAEALHRESEGNPLFVVELLQSHRWRTGTDDEGEGGSARRDGEGNQAATSASSIDAVPSGVRRVIQARLGQLSPAARELVSLLATVGRDITVDVLRHVAPEDSARLGRVLDELTTRHLVREGPAGTLDFTHDKIREVAYSEASEVQRALMHERVARALKEANATRPDMVAGEIARHLERAELEDEAIEWRRKAADRALKLHAFREAANHLDRALALLEGRPDGEERASEELELQVALGAALVDVDHYLGPRVIEAFSRARELCERLGQPVGAPVLRATALSNLMRSRLQDALEEGYELMSLAERSGDPMIMAEAHYVLGATLYWQGRIRDGRDHLSGALERYRPDRARQHLALFAQDPSVVCGVRLGLAEWQLGDAEGGHRRCLEALARARELDHPFTLGYGRVFATWVFIECGDMKNARRETAALVRETREHGIAVWPAFGGIAEGFLLAEAGNPSEGLKRLRSASEEWPKHTVSIVFPYHQCLYARTCARADEVEEGLAAVAGGLEMAERTGNHAWDAELHRLEGELLRMGGAPDEAVEASVRRALAIAREQGATALQERAERALPP